MEKAQLPLPAEHPSYQRHRRELWRKIIAPMLVAAVLLIALVVWIVLVTFRSNGDVARWAALSTIWLVVPVLFAGLLVLVIVLAMIYGMARLLQLIPPYSGYAQRLVWRAQGYIQRGADLVVKPIFGAEGLIASLRRIFRNN
jgi:lysylphosphatidylglycerol synthetase-like protein (DUF2156 family)